jgi:tRNA threonylcarbamoyladenosine biosynthesis protein TsaE
MHLIKTKTYLFSEHELESTAEVILAELPPASIVLINGQMGVGKTTLVKALCKKLGVKESVSSPTYALVNEYQGSTHKIFHFDLYRLKDEEELLNIGFEDYLYQKAYVFIEWPQLAQAFLPETIVTMQLEVIEQKRQLTLTF